MNPHLNHQKGNSMRICVFCGASAGKAQILFQCIAQPRKQRLGICRQGGDAW